MDYKSEQPPQYNQANPSVNQFAAQPSYGQPVIVQQSMNNYLKKKFQN